MSEQPTVDDSVRLAVLQGIFAPKKAIPVENNAIVESKDITPEPTGTESFGELLERCIEKQTKMSETNTKQLDEAKEKIIKNVRWDILEDMKL